MTFRIVPRNIAVIALLIGGISIMNSMLGTVTERTGEVDLRKSIRAKRRNILLHFLIEYTTISVIDGCLGIFVGNLPAYGIGDFVARPCPAEEIDGVGQPTAMASAFCLCDPGRGVIWPVSRHKSLKAGPC